MHALRITAEGATASFRYAHLHVGVQPSYPAPPPSTIYGLIVAVTGQLFPPDALQFAYSFRHQGSFMDYEHIHWVAPRDINMNPVEREQFFMPRLTLYLAPPPTQNDGDNILDYLGEQFQQPFQQPVFGRSQDLITFTEVQALTLQRETQAFVDGSLMAIDDLLHLERAGQALQLPKYISPERQVHWGRYGFVETSSNPPLLDDMMAPDPFWVDPTIEHPHLAGHYRAVLWHGWT